MNTLEILSDFNGFSWDINVNLKNNIEDNLIYQNLMILFGDKFLDRWLNESTTKVNNLNIIKNNLYDTKYFENLCKYLYIMSNDKEKQNIDKLVKNSQEELNTMVNKSKYFDDLKDKKMKYLREVERIDKLLNDKDLLRKQYIAKNLKLGEGKRMTSVHVYRRIVENRREVCLNKILELTKAGNPVNFMNRKRELEEFIRIGNINVNKEECVFELQKEFIKILYNEINNLEDDDEIVNYIYKIRYYRFIYLTREKRIKDFSELEEKINEVQKLLITNACKLQKLRIITSDIDINFEIIKCILDTKIMDLEAIKFEVKTEEGKLKIKVYEEEVYEKDFEIEIENPKKILKIKTNKVMKLFI